MGQSDVLYTWINLERKRGLERLSPPPSALKPYPVVPIYSRFASQFYFSTQHFFKAIEDREEKFLNAG